MTVVLSDRAIAQEVAVLEKSSHKPRKWETGLRQF